MDGTLCPHCGMTVEAGAARCPTCGARLTAAHDSASSAPASPPADDKPTRAPFVVAASPAADQTTEARPGAASPEAAPEGAPVAETTQEPAASGPTRQPTPAPAASAAPQPAPPGNAQPAWGAAPAGRMQLPTMGYPAYPAYPAYPQGYAPPGYPAYPQGQAQPQPGYPAYPQGYSPWAGYGFPPQGYYPPYPAYGYYAPVAPRPRRHPSDVYALVVSWIVTVAGGLSVLCGLLVAFILFVTLANGTSDSLDVEDTFVVFLVAPLVGGVLALWYGIRGIRHKPSPRFTLAHPAFFGALTAVVFVAAVVLWHVYPAPGAGPAVLPLVALSGAAPALTILAFAAWRLRFPTSRRHVWMSLIYGSTLGALTALILNTIGEVLIIVFLRDVQANGQVADPLNPSSQSSPTAILATFLLISLLAPMVEEGVKPLGAVLIMRRLKSPAGAFLTGLAAGIGFDMFETLLYIGRGEADWITVAIGRIGAGLLHGVGAGMGALGWYYLINGRGVPHRWWRGVGGLAYAVLQHGAFNGTTLLLAILPGAFGQWVQQPFYIGRLPLDHATLFILLFYAVIICVLVYVTGRLRRIPAGDAAKPPLPPATLPQPPQSPPPQTSRPPEANAVGSAAR